jgi:hypothetical protein
MAARVFVFGFGANALLCLFNRWVLVKFPLNLLLVGLLVYAGLGLAAGVLAGGRGTDALKRRSLVLAVLAGAWLFGLLANQNVTTHYLLGSVYYPYPLPPRAYLRVGGLVLAIFLSPVPLYIAGHLFGDALRSARRGSAAFGWFALGMAAAAPAAHFSLLWLGLYAPMVAACALAVAFLPDRRWAVLGLLLCAAAAWSTSHNKNESFYVWRIDEYNHLSTHWTPYYRLDFITFKQGQCIGGVYNTIMIWYACDSVEHYPTEMRRLMAELSRGKERVLLAGRTDGLYAGMLLDANPDIKEFESVAFDPAAADLMAGEYAQYNGRVFKRRGMSVEAADIRQAVRERANAGKKYDLIFHNGIGIRLFNMPHSVFLQEDYLTARENYDDIFNKLLSPNGVYVIDWGSSMEDEVYPMLANIPDDVHVRAFHIWIGEFPLSGLPLFYVIAARDKAQLDRIAARILLMPTVREVDLKPDMIAAAKFNQNRPIHHKPLAPGLLTLMMPFFILLVAATAHAGFREPWRMPVRRAYAAWYAGVLLLLYLMFFNGNMAAMFRYKVPMTHRTRVFAVFLFLLIAAFLVQYLVRSLGKWGGSFFAGRGRIATYCWFAGLGSGLAETFVYSRHARNFPGGPGYGIVWIGAAWALGFALAAGSRFFTSRKSESKSASPAILSVAAIAALLFILYIEIVPLNPDPAIGSVLVYLISLCSAGFWYAGLSSVGAESRARALGLMLLGSLAGMYLFQWLVVFFGYLKSGVIIGFVFLFAAGLFKLAQKQFAVSGRAE